MNQLDYDKALHFMIWGQWDDLLVLMVRTRDNFLSKKIEAFLHASYYPGYESSVLESHDELLQYIDHAQAATEQDVFI
ncbi:YhdB family protein [Halobacillus salinarum]|uniref:YhdB family protein n=1 Tax=Halobacillus salinarum TaxID=2932257 RepID=A0ABY4EN99_9BACI|nr:YhdB family protein [Halobacillus salinarum]UOQ43586.1 YhdB family protein [Halobacillus salinarum]